MPRHALCLYKNENLCTNSGLNAPPTVPSPLPHCCQYSFQTPCPFCWDFNWRASSETHCLYIANGKLDVYLGLIRWCFSTILQFTLPTRVSVNSDKEIDLRYKLVSAVKHFDALLSICWPSLWNHTMMKKEFIIMRNELENIGLSAKNPISYLQQLPASIQIRLMRVKYQTISLIGASNTTGSLNVKGSISCIKTLQ